MTMPPLTTPTLYLHSLGHFHPDNVIDNRFLQDESEHERRVRAIISKIIPD